MTHYSRSNGVLSSILDRSLLPSPQAYYGQYFTLKGSKPFVCCPFHHEKTASFQIYLDTGRFYCFGCGEQGDIVAYHMKKHGYTFVEAVKHLGANIAPIANETTEAKAARIARQAEAERQYQERKQQADNEVLAEAQAFIPTVKDILKHHANSLSIPPYIEAKGVIMDNLQAIEASVLKKYKDEATGKVLGYGMTGVLAVIPLHTMKRELVALQVINGEPDEKGKYSRRFIGKPSTLKAFFFIGNFTAPDVVLICEGVADALSLFEATGYPVLCALSASRLTEAAQAARNAYPQAKIILCADNDSNGQGQQAALTAAQAVNGYLALPQSPHKDFNDIHRLEGLEQVNAIIQESTLAVVAVVAEKTAENDPIDPDLINKTIEALPTPEERNKARALQSAMQTIEPQDAIGESLSTGEKIIGFGLSHEYKQAQDSIGALLAMDWDNITGGNSFSHYMGADLKYDGLITVASIYNLAVSKGWVMPHELIELPDPLPIKQSLAPVMPFSADLLPHALREFVMDESDRMPCPPDFVAVSILTTLGSTIGASCGIKPKQKDDGWIIVPNQWGGIVAPPTSLKTPAMEAGIKPLNKLVEEAIKNHESELKTHKRDELAYQARVEGLHADLKSASKTTARKKAEHTANEFVDLIMEAEDNAPPPPVMRRYLTNDATIEKLGELERDNPNGILLMRDELMGWLAGLEKEGKQEDRAFYLEGFNGTGSKVVDRIMRGSTFIKNHCLSVLGGIQPDKLIAYFEQQISGLGNDGLLQRFQLLVYPDAMTWGYRDRYQNKDALNAILELFKKLSESDFLEFGAYPIDEYNKRPYFRFTLDAQAFFIEWLKKLNTEIIANEENTLIQQHLGKYARLMPSLALIFHLVDCVTHDTQGQVSLESAKQAAYWCEYLETHARRVYGLFDGMGMRPAVALSQKLKVCLNPTAKTDKTSEDWLKDGFVFRDIRRKQWQHLKDDTSIKKALMVLVDNYWIYPVSVKSASNGGRPTTRYYISQKLKVCLHPTAKTDETQKTYNLGDEVGQKIGFGSFGSDLMGQFENLANNANGSLSPVDSVILANSDDAMEYEDGGID